ncbi:MAG: hypothetical protein RLZ57_468 [Actinomycetota bacterium]|jgi:putative hemolysin
MALFKDLLLVSGLILFAALFVSAEIALLSLREGQIKQLALKGIRGERVFKLTRNPNRFLAAAQVGITVCGFLSAALGAERLSRYIAPTLSEWGLSKETATTTAIVIVTLLISYFSLVFGELVPKRLAIYKSEMISLQSAPVLDLIAKLFRPIIWTLSKSTDLVMRLFGIDPKVSRDQISEEELVDLVTGHTALTEEERDIVEEVFNASDRAVSEVMVPRTEVEFMDSSLPVSKAIALAVEKSHSRYPVVRGSTDEVIGFIHVRDLLDPNIASPNAKIQELVRSVMFLPGTKGVLPALTEMREQRQHLAIVLDEYGGTDGIVTLENLVECLIGEIRDEYDDAEEEISLETRTGDLEIDGLTSLTDLFDETGIEIPEGPYKTVSGFVMHFLGRMPKVHDVVNLNGIRIVVLTLEGHRVGQLLISRSE